MKKLLILQLFLFVSTTLSASVILPQKTTIENYLKPIEITEEKSGLWGVDCIYVINLDERPEKWNRMKELCLSQGLNANRVSAINGWKIPKAALKELSGPYPIRMLGGHFGCLLSHISVLKDAWDRKFSLIWILEDDVEFVEDVRVIPNILERLTSLDPNWDLFFTDPDSKNNQGQPIRSLAVDFRPDQDHYPPAYYQKRISINNDITMIRQRFGSYSMFITRKGLEKMLHYFTHVYLWSPIDVDIHYVPDIRTYSAKRDLVSVWLNTNNRSDTYHKVP
ncbi:MAG: glycosyltransferase family 25 protein [Parachlamydiales bacterium]|nr:glycosyltransferase family 25 protein [Parachlamydiales bacterium]